MSKILRMKAQFGINQTSLYYYKKQKLANQLAYVYSLLPLRPPFRRVESDGMGVTSSIRPIFIPDRANARKADWAPGPGVLVRVPPVALNLMWRALIPSVRHFSATSWAASIAA